MKEETEKLQLKRNLLLKHISYRKKIFLCLAFCRVHEALGFLTMAELENGETVPVMKNLWKDDLQINQSFSKEVN